MQTRIVTNKFEEIGFTTMKFSGGEVQIRLDQKYKSFWIRHDFEIFIVTHIDSSEKLMELLLITDALRREGVIKIGLKIPYLPYARQDRVCFPGEALSIKVMCDIINSQNYFVVEIWDVHSNISLALLNNVDHVEAYELIPNDAITRPKPVLVAPDYGAVSRVTKVAQHYDLDMITAEKIRDPKTGEITGTNVGVITQTWLHRDFLIVDDICDGGRTFIELAKVIQKQTLGNINLYVTHGIFSKGFDVFKGLIKNIYVANSFIDKTKVPDFVHVN